MVELELVGIHSDGEHLVVLGPDGSRYRLLIDDALRAAVRRDRPQLEKVRTSGSLRPREIQERIRAGASAEDVAADADIPVATVRRYEGPVLAERDHVASQARRMPIGRETDSPVLGDVVVDRLATRDVEAESISWSARRFGHSPWQVIAAFSCEGRDLAATWEVDLSAKMLHALDDEARWLSEIELDHPASPRRHLQAVHTKLYDVEADFDEQAEASALSDSIQAVDEAVAHHEDGDTASLLDELNSQRGVRSHPLAEEFPEDDSTLWDDPPAAHPSDSHPHEVLEPETPVALEPTDEGDDETATDTGDSASEPRKRGTGNSKRGRRAKRTSVPSWDEIVFGAKND